MPEFPFGKRFKEMLETAYYDDVFAQRLIDHRDNTTRQYRLSENELSYIEKYYKSVADVREDCHVYFGWPRQRRFSKEFKRVLERAFQDRDFAQGLIQDRARTLRDDYQLEESDVAYIEKYYRSVDDVRKDYVEKFGRPLGRPSRLVTSFIGLLRGRLGLTVTTLVLLALLIIVAYLLISALSASFLEWLGVPHLDAIGTADRLRGFVVTFIIFLLAMLLATRTLYRQEYRVRMAVVISLTILVLIPAAIAFGTVSPDAQIVLIRVLLIIAFTTLPASFYVLFTSGRREILWKKFLVDLQIIDPLRADDAEWRAYYQHRFESIYGRIDAADQSRQGRRAAGQVSFLVIFATSLIGLGWFLILFVFALEGDFAQIDPNPFAFGFLGAYFFALGLLFRRYLHSDLKAKAYSHVSKRILTTWVLAAVLMLIPGVDARAASVVAFVAGIFPDIAWQVIRQAMYRLFGLGVRSLSSHHPLHTLQGMTIWVEARLMEEDIEDMQNLVTADIVELLLRTNFPTERLLNWIDQSMLALRLTHPDGRERRPLSAVSARLSLVRPPADEPLVEQPQIESRGGDLKVLLSERGILTATDLLYSLELLKKDEELKRAGLVPAITTIARTLDNQTNMYHLLAWRDAEVTLCEQCHTNGRPADFEWYPDERRRSPAVGYN